MLTGRETPRVAYWLPMHSSTVVANHIWLRDIKTQAALLKQFADFSKEEAKEIVDFAKKIDVWKDPYGDGPKTNKVAKLTGFVQRILTAKAMAAKAAKRAARSPHDDPKLYTPSLCNHPHYLKTGKPFRHECRAIPPAKLREWRSMGM